MDRKGKIFPVLMVQPELVVLQKQLLFLKPRGVKRTRPERNQRERHLWRKMLNKRVQVGFRKHNITHESGKDQVLTEEILDNNPCFTLQIFVSARLPHCVTF